VVEKGKREKGGRVGGCLLSCLPLLFGLSPFYTTVCLVFMDHDLTVRFCMFELSVSNTMDEKMLGNFFDL
jgi:hypothetical protein